MTEILVLSGSLRSASITNQIANLALTSTPAGVNTLMAPDLSKLPFYNQDLDTDNPPQAVAELRRLVSVADAVLFVSPENNGSVSAVLKNAIDWLSRPRGAAPLDGRRVALVVAGWSLSAVETHLEHILHVAGADVVFTPGRSINLKSFRGQSPSSAPHVVGAVADALHALADATTLKQAKAS